MSDDITVSVYSEDPDMVYLSTTTEDGTLIRAAARVSKRHGRLRVEPSVWETEDGAPVDAPKLSKQAIKLVKKFVIDGRDL